MNTTENNKLIVKFMELEPIKVSTDFYALEKNHVHITGRNPEIVISGFSEFAKYNTDWNWLMEVVEKIENQYRSKFSKNTFPCVSISSICCKISFYGNYEEVIANIVRPTKIEAVYDSYIEFIKWYNKQK